MTLSPEVLHHTSKWMVALRRDWHEEIPLKIHSSDYADDGTYRWSGEFAAWINGTKKNGERRFRMKQVMRKLRAKSIREYEVAYRMIVLDEPIDKTTEWLNERAKRNDKPERYSVDDTRVIIVSAVDKLLAWY